MADLTLRDFQQLLLTYLQDSGQIQLLEMDQKPPLIKQKVGKDSLTKRLRRKISWTLGEVEMKFRLFGARDYWIPDPTPPILQISNATACSETKFDIAVHLHVYFLDLLPELLFHTQNIGQNFTCYVTTDMREKVSAIELLLEKHPLVKSQKVIVVPNKGRDIAPWVIEMAPYHERHDLWCHIHTKKSLHIPSVGKNWRRFLLKHLLGNRNSVQQILNAFSEEPNLGIVIPPFYIRVINRVTRAWDSISQAEVFFESLKIDRCPPERPIFSAGSMSWYRPEALGGLFSRGFTYDDFEPETNQVSGTIAHLVERSLVYIAENMDFNFRILVLEKNEIPASRRRPKRPAQ